MMMEIIAEEFGILEILQIRKTLDFFLKKNYNILSMGAIGIDRG